MIRGTGSWRRGLGAAVGGIKGGRARLSNIRSWKDVPSSGGSALAWGLISGNALVYLTWELGGPKYRALISEHMVSSYVDVFEEGKAHTLITSCFLHTNIQSLLISSLGIYFIAGNMVVPAMGAGATLSMYLAGGIMGNALAELYCRYARDYKRYVPRYVNRFAGLHGSAPAISALMAWATLVNPMQTVMVQLFIPVPLLLVSLGYFGWPIYAAGQLTALPPSDFAQLGGGAAGVAIFLLSRGRARL